MNQSERNSFKLLSDKIDELVEQATALDAEEVEALREIAALAPTLKELADAWKSAAWFASALKWLGALGAALAAIAVAVRIFIGDGK